MHIITGQKWQYQRGKKDWVSWWQRTLMSVSELDKHCKLPLALERWKLQKCLQLCGMLIRQHRDCTNGTDNIGHTIPRYHDKQEAGTFNPKDNQWKDHRQESTRKELQMLKTKQNISILSGMLVPKRCNMRKQQCCSVEKLEKTKYALDVAPG